MGGNKFTQSSIHQLTTDFLKSRFFRKAIRSIKLKVKYDRSGTGFSEIHNDLCPHFPCIRPRPRNIFVRFLIQINEDYIQPLVPFTIFIGVGKLFTIIPQPIFIQVSKQLSFLRNGLPRCPAGKRSTNTKTEVVNLGFQTIKNVHPVKENNNKDRD